MRAYSFLKRPEFIDAYQGHQESNSHWNREEHTSRFSRTAGQGSKASVSRAHSRATCRRARWETVHFYPRPRLNTLILTLSKFRKPDESRKHVHDSFTSLTKQLAAHPASSSSSSYRPSLSPKANRDKPSEVQAWLSIESTERERASELIRPKKKTVPDTRRNGEGGEELVLVPNKVRNRILILRKIYWSFLFSVMSVWRANVSVFGLKVKSGASLARSRREGAHW